MNIRVAQKAESRQRIVEAAALRLRKNGASGTGVVEVMADAGLTHGGFYAHFENKESLLKAAFQEAMQSRDGWFVGLDGLPYEERVSILLERYLNSAHRDNPGKGCPMPAVAPDMAHRELAMQPVLAQELEITIAGIARLFKADPESDSSLALAERADAIAALSLCVGGLLLARAVGDNKLSAEILGASRKAGERAFAKKTVAKRRIAAELPLGRTVKVSARRGKKKS